MRYVLASGSPRRRELLSKLIPSFEVIPSKGEENPKGEMPSDIVKELSFQKASEIFHKLLMDSNDRLVVIGSDTVVSYNHRVLGKPADNYEAAEMIRCLQGNSHSVFTGVTVFYTKDGQEKSFSFSECTKVFVSVMSDEEIGDYVASGEPMDKAGAYGIQGQFAKFVTGIDGDYYNVMGLPVARLYQELKAHELI